MAAALRRLRCRFDSCRGRYLLANGWCRDYESWPGGSNPPGEAAGSVDIVAATAHNPRYAGATRPLQPIAVSQGGGAVSYAASPGVRFSPPRPCPDQKSGGEPYKLAQHGALPWRGTECGKSELANTLPRQGRSAGFDPQFPHYDNWVFSFIIKQCRRSTARSARKRSQSPLSTRGVNI